MPRLVVEKGVDKGLWYRVRPGETVLCGRDVEARLQLSDSLASRRHFRIKSLPDGYHLTDLRSSNGTFLNGKRVKSARINIGDQVQVGETLISFLDDTESPTQTGLVGQELGGYLLLERIGRGGMGTVYRARQISLDRIVALKILSKRLTADKSFIERFRREARAVGKLVHPNIVQAHDVGNVGDVYFFSMEYMAGGSIGDRIAHSKRLTAGEAIPMLIDVARGLQYAEQQHIIHRDIKPDNLMIDEEGRIKIGDLGIAETLSGTDYFEQTDGIFGSPHYMAPEQAAGKRLDHRADIYSLGATFYRILSGSTIFTGSSPTQIMRKQVQEGPVPLKTLIPSLPSRLCQIIDKMLAKDSDDRYANATELLADLTQMQQSRESGAARRRPAPVKPVPAKMRLISVAVGSLILVIVGILLGVYLAGCEPRSPAARLYSRVVELDKKGLSEQATQLCDTIIKKYPKSAWADEARKRLAYHRSAQKQLEEAVRYAQANPRDYAGTISLLEEIVELQAHTDAANKARTLIAQARADEALQEVHLYAAANPREHQEIVRRYEEVIENHPGTRATAEARRSIATRLLDEIRRYEKDNPYDWSEIIRKCEEVIRDYPDTDAVTSVGQLRDFAEARRFAWYNPYAYPDVLRRLQQVVRKHPGGEIGKQARKLMAQVRDRMDLEARAADDVERLNKDAPELLKLGRFIPLCALLENIMVGYKGTRAAETAAEHMRRVHFEAENELARRRKKIVDLCQKGDLAQCRQLHRAATQRFSFHPYLARLAQKLNWPIEKALARRRRESFDLHRVISQCRAMVRECRSTQAAEHCRRKAASYKDSTAAARAAACSERLGLLAAQHAGLIKAINDKSIQLDAADVEMKGTVIGATELAVRVAIRPNVVTAKPWRNVRPATLCRYYRRLPGDGPGRLAGAIYCIEIGSYDLARRELDYARKKTPALAGRADKLAAWLAACEGAEKESAAFELLAQAATAQAQKKLGDALDALKKLQEEYAGTNVFRVCVPPVRQMMAEVRAAAQALPEGP